MGDGSRWRKVDKVEIDKNTTTNTWKTTGVVDWAWM